MEYTYQYLKTRSKIMIGDKTIFKPKVKIAKWDDAHAFTLELEELGTFTPTVDSVTGKIDGKANDKDFSITYTQTPVKPVFNDEGGLDIVITQGKVGLSNVINFTYSNQNVVGYLQPPLTAKEIAEGCSRPDYVVNSIAFYATDEGGMQVAGGIEWKTGKVGHLYRMKAHSYDGKVPDVWCDWSINGNTVSLTIPLSWWNDSKTKFPITISPVGDTFGYGTMGASAQPLWMNWWAASKFTGAAGTATKLTGAFASYYSGTTNLKGLIVDSTLTIVSNSISNPTSIPYPTVPAQWFNFTFGTNPTLISANYWLGVVVSTNAQYPWVMYDSGSTNQFAYESDNNYTSPTNPSSPTYLAYKLSIYCTYTPAGGGWTGIAKVNGVGQAAILKINGVAKAAIAKISGRAV